MHYIQVHIDNRYKQKTWTGAFPVPIYINSSQFKNYTIILYLQIVNKLWADTHTNTHPFLLLFFFI